MCPITINKALLLQEGILKFELSWTAVIIKFMMHWLAFNWLYSECAKEYEWENIQCFCRNNMIILSTFDAFNTDGIKIFKQEPVRDGEPPWGQTYTFDIIAYSTQFTQM